MPERLIRQDNIIIDGSSDLEQPEVWLRPSDAILGFRVTHDGLRAIIPSSGGQSAIIHSVEVAIFDDCGVAGKCALPRPIKLNRDAFAMWLVQFQLRAIHFLDPK